MREHTPGKWEITVSSGLLKVEIASGHTAIATVWTKRYGTPSGDEKTCPIIPWPEGEANARLIPIAPEMLEELIIMRDWLREQLGEWLPVEPSHYPNQRLVEMREHLDHIEDVIKKAEARA